MGSCPATHYCYKYLLEPTYDQYYNQKPYVNLTNLKVESLYHFCNLIRTCESDLETEGGYSQPMVLIGIYISIASLFCVLAMALDLLNGLRNRKYWFPSKYFSLNAASITVIAVAMKLPVDLTSPMPGDMDQVGKVGGLAFMCTMMSNLLPSLASMDDKSLLANVTGLSILVITIIANIIIQIRTKLIDFYFFDHPIPVGLIFPCIYLGILLFLLMIMISSAVMIPTAKKVLEFKFRGTSKTTNINQHPQENLIPTVEKLRQLVKRYWIMAETGNPQFVMASNPLSCASGIVCAVSMLMYIFVVWELVLFHKKFSKDGHIIASLCRSVYKGSMMAIDITQCIGIVVGSIAPIFRCFTVLSFKSFTNKNKKHFLVFKVEKYWTQKLYEWKEVRISFLFGGIRSRALLHNLKNLTLSFCMGFQKVVIVSCKIIGLLPIVVVIFVVYCSYYFKSVKVMLFSPSTTSTADDHTNEDLSNYVLSLEDNMWLAQKTINGISDSMNRLIHNAERKPHNNLLKLLEESDGFEGVETFDTDQLQSQLCEQHVNSWSLPIISLTCIAVALPNIHKDRVDKLFKSVGEGLLYTHLVEECLNKPPEYVNIRNTTVKLWHEVEDNYKWLEITLKRSAYEGKTPIEIIKSFAHVAEEIVSDFNTSTGGEPLEKENLPQKLVIANSMYRITQTIVHTYEINNSKIIEHELFTRLSRMIAGILAACLTNIPRVVTIRCHESTIEKREASVAAAINLLGHTTEIIKILEKRELPNMDPNKMGFIDEWRLHLKQP